MISIFVSESKEFMHVFCQKWFETREAQNIRVALEKQVRIHSERLLSDSNRSFNMTSRNITLGIDDRSSSVGVQIKIDNGCIDLIFYK